MNGLNPRVIGKIWLVALALGVLSPGALAQTMRLQSKNELGLGSANNNSQEPVISWDGEWVAFSSGASDLVSGDTNFLTDVFLTNTRTGALARLSESTFGVQADGESGNVEIARSSGPQQWVVFESSASNLVPNDTNQSWDVFLAYYPSGVTQRVSVSSSGGEGNSGSTFADVSADGRWVVFESNANNLVPGDSNGYRDIFVHDPALRTTRRINLDSSGNQLAGAHSFEPSISDDGRYVVYVTPAANAAVNWSGNGWQQVILIDRDANGNGTWDEVADLSQSQLLSVGTQVGTGANSSSYSPKISGDGSAVVFASWATNLVASDTNGRLDIFVRDRVTSLTSRVDVDDFGAQADRDCERPRISTNGRFVVFDSLSTNLDVTQIDPSDADVFLHDRQAGTTRRVSQSRFYGPFLNEGVQGDVSDDGRFVAIRSAAAFDPIDGNFRWDVYVKDRIDLKTIAPRQTGQPFGFEIETAFGEGGNGFLVLVGCQGVTPGIPVPNTVDLTVPVQADFCTNIALGLPAFFSGTIQIDGTGTTLPFPFPAIPPGILLYGAALTWNPQSGLFESVTEPISF